MLHYTTTGNGTENLVLLHGFLENSKVWEDLIPLLSSKFRIITIDLPGHGESVFNNDSTLTMEHMATLVDEVLMKENLSTIHLLGHSMGGYVALAFAEKHKDRLKSLTLFFSTYWDDDEEKKETRRKSLRIIKENFRTYVNAGIPNFFSPTERNLLENQIVRAKQLAMSTNPDAAIACMKGMIERPNRKKILDQTDGKVLVIAGKHDAAVKTSLVIEHLPDRLNIKSYVLDCGHNGQYEKPEICAAIMNTELLTTAQ